jgi:hypothetical protein
MNLYYLALLKKQESKSILEEIMAGSELEEVKMKIQEQIDKDVQKLKGDGFDV